MKQINLHQIKEDAKKYWIYAVAIIAIFLCFFQYNNTNFLETRVSELKSSIKEREKQKVTLTKDIISRDKIIAQSDIRDKKAHRKIDSLSSVLTISKRKIIEIQKTGKNKISQIKKSKHPELVQFFKEKYKPSDSIIEIENKLCFTDTITRQVATDLIKGEYAHAELKQTQIVLKQTETQSAEKDIRINEKDIKIDQLECQKADMDSINKLNEDTKIEQNKIISDQEKIITKKGNKTVFYMITTGISAALNIFLIVKH